MAADKTRRTKCKLSVYLSARPSLSPILTEVTRLLSPSVAVKATTEDPEEAYFSIHESDVFLFVLHRDTCQQLLALYELGVAVIFRKPVVVIREANFALSQLLIPPHFYETEIMLRPGHGGLPSDTTREKRTTFHSLGDLLAYAYENSLVFSEECLSKCVDELLDRVLNIARFWKDIALKNPNSYIIKAKSRSAVKTTKILRNGRSFLVREDCNSPTQLRDTVTQEDSFSLCTQTNYMANVNADQSDITVCPIFVEFPRKVYELKPMSETEEQLERTVSPRTYDMVHLDVKAPTSSNITPLPSPTLPQQGYYPTVLPANPIHLSFPPLNIEGLEFNKYAVAIAKSDRLPSVIRRRIIRKSL